MPNLACGIVGLPNVGKSTLFNAITKKMVPASNFPFCTIEPNIGIVEVPDPRLKKLSDVSKSQKIVPATISFVDIAGLVRGASQGEGLGNQFLTNIRETDLIVEVVRCFDDDNVIHVQGRVNPADDIEVINLELILADLQMAEKIFQKIEKTSKSQKEKPLSYTVLPKIIQHLNDGKPLRSLSLSDEEAACMKQYQFLTSKPLIYSTNVSENDIPSFHNDYVKQVIEIAKKEGADIIPICARLEEELASLPPLEAKEYLASYGLTESGLDRLIKTAFHTLGLITFYTSGEKETRAWTIKKGATAPEAAGEIHSDIQKGFIRAEVISYDDLIKHGGNRALAREAGCARMEGKNYIVQDDDVILFYHN